MEIIPSGISCGIYELRNLGDDSNNYYAPTREKLMLAMKNRWPDFNIPRCALMIASINHRQKKAEKFLLENGFKRVSDWHTNPNTYNKIALFMLEVWPDAKEIKG